MNPIEWLCAHAPGFGDLPEADRQAIFYFSLLWSLFEAKALGTRGSTKGIEAFAHEWASQGELNLAPFQASLDYFRARYVADGEPTEFFHGLGLRTNDNLTLVHSVLAEKNANPRDTVSALLIIVYRLRNNLFHGVKWSYGIQGQLESFTHANAILMMALENMRYR